MALYLVNTQFQKIRLVDDYISLIWPEKYLGYSEFELYMRANAQNIADFQPDMMLKLEGSNVMMFIEKVEITTDLDSGAFMSIKGYPLEAWPSRRIVWGQRILTGNLQSAVQSVLSSNMLSTSTISARRFLNMTFVPSTDPGITSLTIDAQFTGTPLDEFLKSVLEPEGLGYRIVNTTGRNTNFELYKGVDRSYSQPSYPYVVFSPKFDNLLSSEYKASVSNYKTAALVAGEGEGVARRTRTVTKGSPTATGVNRRELFVDARDISSEVDGDPLTTTQYNNLLDQRGREKLTEFDVETSFEGGVDDRSTYQYGTHFNLGDIVQVEDEYGNSSPARVVEFIRVHSSSEEKSYPTFKSL